MAKVAPPIELRSPYLAMPTISNSSARPRAATPMRSPTARFSSSATPSSTADLAVARGPAALDQVQRVEAVVLRRGLDAERERRRAAGVHGVAVGLEQLRLEVLDRAGGDLDAVDITHVLECVVRDRRRLSRLALEVDPGLLARDHDVRAGVRVDEDGVERLVDRVREDVGAAHHRDAEDDRKRREEGPQLAPGHAAERDLDHLRVISSSAASTACSSAPGSSLTISPSARKRIRSAVAAARASCVTMTSVWP